MGAITTDLPATTSGTFSVETDSPQFASARDENPGQTIEHIQGELISLSVRQREVQRRIHHVRHALGALVQAFGPGILAAASPGVRLRNVSRSAPKMIEALRSVLSCSSDWLTFSQLLEAVRAESPSMLAGFINPGVSVSNALRALQRRGEIEVLTNESQAMWRWAGRNRLAQAEKSAEIL
ncbi:MAG TPA: hypothetical protein VJO35_04205 [Terriglobales bacterium]|nr:hypothetical protein [Terriglobales bacterium]